MLKDLSLVTISELPESGINVVLMGRQPDIWAMVEPIGGQLLDPSSSPLA